MLIHATDLMYYLSCRRAFKFANVDRITPLEYKEPDYFRIGKEWHLAMREHYLSGDATEVVRSIKNDDDRNHVTILYESYSKTYNDSNWEVASIENPITIRVDVNGVELELTFTMDLMVMVHDNLGAHYAIVDHKLYSRFPELPTLDFDFQILFYYWAARRVGLDIQEFILNVTRKNPPKYPSTLKNGQLSKSQKVLDETEYEMYLWSINELGLDVYDYQNELDFLRNRGSNTFKRYSIKKSVRELEIFEANLFHLLNDIANDKTFIPHPTYECYKCKYNFLCRMMNLGNDLTGTLKYKFRPKTEDER